MEDIILIILNYNNYKETENCVDNLLNLHIKYEIVIVDNNSKNDSFMKLQNKYKDERNIDVIKTEKNGGYSYGNNFGMKYAIKKYSGINYFCILNPDVEIDDVEIFKKMKEKIINTDISIISPIMLSYGGYFNSLSFGWEIPSNKTIWYNNIIFLKKKIGNRKIKVNNDRIAEVGVVSGSFFMIKKCDIEKIGFLDENVFLYNEENLLAIKLKKIGKKEAILMNAYFYHNHDYSKNRTIKLKEKLKINKIGYQSRKYLCQKFYSRNAEIKLILTNIINIIYICTFGLIKNIIGRKNER